MIEYNSKSWFRHIVEFRKMDTLRLLWLELVIVGLYAALVVYLKQTLIDSLAETSPQQAERYSRILRDTTIVHSILGFVLSLLLVFRTNTAYDRWWEGRKFWGALVNTTRNLAVKYSALLVATNPEVQAIREQLRLSIGDFPFALKEHLRGKVKLEELRSIQHHHQPIPLSDAGRSPGATGTANAGHDSAPISLEWLCIGQPRLTPGFDHLPLAIIGEIYRATTRLRDVGHLGKEELLVIDADLRNLNEIMGGCERILKTPIPYTYSLFLKKFVFFFILLLPLGFAALFGYMSVPLTMFVFYVLVSLEIIAEEIEEPFGEDTNDLPTDKISETIRRNVDEAMGLVGASD